MIAAFLATALSVAVTTGGLFFYVPTVQMGVLGGVCAALIAPTRRSAVAVAAIATFAGAVIGPASNWGAQPAALARLGSCMVSMIVAALAAFAASIMIAQVRRSGRWLTWGVIGLLVANVWMTTIHLAEVEATGYDATDRVVSLFSLLKDPASVTPRGLTIDQYAYLKVLLALRRGEPFYRAWYNELGSNRSAGLSAGSSVLNYHLPTPFLLWAALPGSPVSVVYAYMVLASLAVAAVPLVVRGSVRLPLAIPGAAALAAYLFPQGGTLGLFHAEVWAGAITVLAVAACVSSSSSSRWRTYTIVTVALAVSAALTREPALLVPIAGLISALAVPGERRRFRAGAWAAGLLAFAGIYLVHYVNVRPLLWGTPVGAALRFMGPNAIGFSLRYGTNALGTATAMPMVLAVAGLLGVLLLRDRSALVFVGIAVAASLTAYMFVGNNARDVVSNTPVNYWGLTIVPVIYACIPALFAVLPWMSPGSGGGPPADMEVVA